MLIYIKIRLYTGFPYEFFIYLRQTWSNSMFENMRTSTYMLIIVYFCYLFDLSWDDTILHMNTLYK